MTTSPPAPGGRRTGLVRFLVPGLSRLLEGRWESGGFALLLWAGLVGTALTRWSALLDAPGRGRAPLLAAVSWGLLLAGLHGWAVRDGLAGGEGETDGRRWWSRVLRRLRKSRTAVLALWFLGLLAAAALLAPVLAPFDPVAQGDLVTERLRPPSDLHLLGTDQFARDVLSRTLHGARLSLAIGLLATGIAVSLGTAVGALAGYVGGWLDEVLMRIVDVVLAFPRLVLLITVAALFRPSVGLTVAVLGLTLWPGTARLVRAEILALRERGFAEAARALGYSHPRILFRHLLPNALAPVIVAAGLGVGDTIVLEAGLSFLGLGVQPPDPSLGSMISDGRPHLLRAWWLTVGPGGVLVATVLAFNLVGDALRDALDPRSARREPGL